MARKPKPAERCIIAPHLSANKDCKEKAFLQVGLSLLKDKRFFTLSGAAKDVYLALSMECGKDNFSYTKFTHGKALQYGISRSSYFRGTKELLKKGFIKALRGEGDPQYSPNEFRFCMDWKLTPAVQNEHSTENYYVQNEHSKALFFSENEQGEAAEVSK